MSKKCVIVCAFYIRIHGLYMVGL